MVTHIRRRSELACSGKEPVAEHRQAAHGLRPGCIVLKDILVRVNAVTGETRVSRFVGSFGCGRILNVKTAASQFRGCIIMGLGLARANSEDQVSENYRRQDDSGATLECDTFCKMAVSLQTHPYR